MLDPRLALTDPLLQEVVPRSGHCGRKVLTVLSLLIGLNFATLLCQVPCTLGGYEKHSAAQELTTSMSRHVDLDNTTLGKPAHLAIRPRASWQPLSHLHSASMLNAMSAARQARQVAVAAEEKAPPVGDTGGGGNTGALLAATTGEWAKSTGKLLAASTGVAAAAIAGAGALTAAGAPEGLAQAGVLCSVGSLTVYGMFRGGPFFREDPWEHGAEMMGRADANLMGPTSERPPLQATPPGNAALAALSDEGVVRLNGVLSAASASTARSLVIERLDTVLSEQEGQKEDRSKLGKVTCGKKRYDLLLQPDSGVLETAMREALAGPLGELMKEKVGSDAPLYELAALVSDKGAWRQPVQVDTPYQDEVPMYTAAVALQDESVELGPTLFLPGTHTETAYNDFMGGDLKRSDLLKRTPFYGSMLGVGDAAVYDSRLLHANAQNVKGKRAILYFTFAKPTTDLSKVGGPPGSIAPEAQGAHRLADFLPKA